MSDIIKIKKYNTPEFIGEYIKREFQHAEGLLYENAGLSTGFRDLDRVFGGGLHPGILYILAARPGMGKLSLALKIALHCTRAEGTTTLIFSPSVSKKRILQRMICFKAEVKYIDLIRGKINKEELERVDKALDSIKSYPMFIDDTSIITTAEIRGKCKSLINQNNLPGLVLVDSFQYLEHCQTKKDIKKSTAILKQTALDLNIPVIVTSSLNRLMEKRSDYRPCLSTDFGDYRELANIADVVILQYRNSYYNELDDDYSWLMDCELNIAKNKNGDTDIINLQYTPEYLSFENAF